MAAAPSLEPNAVWFCEACKKPATNIINCDEKAKARHRDTLEHIGLEAKRARVPIVGTYGEGTRPFLPLSLDGMT